MRIRNICPGFWKNEILAKLDYWEQRLFIGLWCLADMKGRLEDRPDRIWLELFGYDRNIKIEQGIDSLVSSEFLVRYEVNGVKLIWIKSFTKYQAISTKEKEKGSIWPPCLDEPAQEPPKRKPKSVPKLTLFTPLSDPGTNGVRPGTDPGTNGVRPGTEPVQPDGGRRTEDEGRMTEEEGAASAGKYSDWFVSFRDVHPNCRAVTIEQFVNMVRPYEKDGDVPEALEAFGRQMAGALSMNVPLREFEKYLRASGRRILEKKQKTGGLEPSQYVPMSERENNERDENTTVE